MESVSPPGEQNGSVPTAPANSDRNGRNCSHIEQLEPTELLRRRPRLYRRLLGKLVLLYMRGVVIRGG